VVGAVATEHLTLVVVGVVEAVLIMLGAGVADLDVLLDI